MSVHTDPRIGTELTGYRIERLLGRAGMGVVYLAHDLRLDRRVALKLLAPSPAEDADFRARFLRESKLASLDHQNAVPIYEAGLTSGPNEATLEVTATIEVGARPGDVAVGGGSVWVTILGD